MFVIKLLEFPVSHTLRYTVLIPFICILACWSCRICTSVYLWLLLSVMHFVLKKYCKEKLFVLFYSLAYYTPPSPTASTIFSALYIIQYTQKAQQCFPLTAQIYFKLSGIVPNLALLWWKNRKREMHQQVPPNKTPFFSFLLKEIQHCGSCRAAHRGIKFLICSASQSSWLLLLGKSKPRETHCSTYFCYIREREMERNSWSGELNEHCTIQLGGLSRISCAVPQISFIYRTAQGKERLPRLTPPHTPTHTLQIKLHKLWYPALHLLYTCRELQVLSVKRKLILNNINSHTETKKERRDQFKIDRNERRTSAGSICNIRTHCLDLV